MTIRYDIGCGKGSSISYIPERRNSPVLIECTIPFLAALSFLSPGEALDEKWAETFQDVQAEWFLPLLRRMAAGEEVSLVEIERAHQANRGSPLRRAEDPRQLKD